jgi:hypothetical protein
MTEILLEVALNTINKNQPTIHDGPTLIVEDLFVVHHHYCRHFIDRYIVISFFLVVSNRKKNKTNKNKQTKNRCRKSHLNLGVRVYK